MTMELSRQEYPNLLQTLTPNQAVTTLNERVKHFERLNDEIADWLQERRRIEELYVQGLRKLARKTPPSEEASDMGVFAQPWQRIVGATESLADSHHNLALKIESDVERPLRDFATSNREMQAMPNMQSNLAGLAKEYDNTIRKSEKLRDKGQRAATNKVANASSDMEHAQGQWQSQAPFVFETLQALDEIRCNQLRDVLTQFQTHEVDQVERNRKSAETCLNALLTIETADEIKTFALRQQSSRRRSVPPMSQQSASQAPQASNLAPRTTSTGDRSEQRSISPSDEPEEKKSGLSRLKRLGTVVGRRKSSTSKTTAQRPKYGREGSGLSGESIPSSTQGTPSRGFVPPIIEEPATPESPTRMRRSRQERPSTSEQTDNTNREVTPELVNGASQSPPPQINEPLRPEVPSKAPQIEEPLHRDSEGFNVPPPTLDPITQAQQEAAATAPEPQFKMAIKDAPIEENRDADTAMANMANTLRAQAVPPKRASTLRGRRDVRNTVFVPSPQDVQPGPGPTASTDQSTAAQPLQEFSTPTGLTQSTVLPVMPPVSTTAPVLSNDAAIGSAQPAHQALDNEARASSDTPSAARSLTMNSNDAQASQGLRSLTSPGANALALRHPEMRQPGLNSSIVETVSTWLEKGEVARATVMGEMAVQYNGDAFPMDGTEKIRLENFETLERVAANPAFVEESPAAPGEYSLRLANMVEANVAFKYQLHVEDVSVSKYVPLTLMPLWKIEPSQTSVILNYSLNPAFDSSSTVTLSNTYIAIYLDTQTGSGKPLSSQSKPVGTFSRERSLIYWHLPELILTPGSAPQKLLARFATEGEAKPGRVEARFEIGGRSSSKLGLSISSEEGGTDPFADEGAKQPSSWKEVETSRKLTTGTYQAV